MCTFHLLCANGSGSAAPLFAVGCKRVVSILFAGLDKLLHCKPDIFGDLPQQNGRNISAGMERDRRTTFIGVAILFI
jgi:hypothetical protein